MELKLLIINTSKMDKQINQQLPNWLWQNSPMLPQVYRVIWDHVKEDRSTINGINEKYLVDTNKVFPLLLTSQLPTEVLGFIWSLANKKYAGQLTEQELYIVLSLIALAQTSYSFNNLDILHMLPGPPTPSLNLAVLNPIKINTIDNFTSQRTDTNKKYIDSNLDLKLTQKPQKLGAIETKDVDLSDDFTEFQSATVVSPSLPTKIDTKLGSAIGSRLANHNLLSGPKKLQDKQIKKTNNKITINQCKTSVNNFNQDLATLSNDLNNCERVGDLFPTCMIKNEAKTFILNDTVIRNDMSIPVERNNITFNEKKNDPIDLMNLQSVEDKYSALRILVDEPKIESIDNDKTADDDDNILDDFGDFVSAKNTDTTDVNQLDSSIDLFTDFENFLPSCGDHKSEISLVQETIEAFAQLEINSSPEKTLDYLEEKYEATIDPDKIIQRDIDKSFNQIKKSKSMQSLDLNLCLEKDVDVDKEIKNMHEMIYWEWKQYMESCVLLLQFAANIFTSITSDIVLEEVLKSSKGYNFLCNLAEIAAVCRRVNYSHKEMDINIMGFDDLLMDIDKIWAQMEPFYTNIPIVTELPAWPSRQDQSPTCALCLTVITSDNILFNDNHYHATCANLWLNCVNNNLPILRYPINNSHGILTGGTH
ncbi:synergin gamma-like [Aphidius gifuensis]|uniref:synergin gamma-like n=1 Tax=Aphidius gifuensis TaxID=684658 RepID=UPI001CDB9031|nr:synergin gamma-like [Aphidius gifuensis]